MLACVQDDVPLVGPVAWVQLPDSGFGVKE